MNDKLVLSKKAYDIVGNFMTTDGYEICVIWKRKQHDVYRIIASDGITEHLKKSGMVFYHGSLESAMDHIHGIYVKLLYRDVVL